MSLTALFISVGVVAAVCAIFWLLERIFDITMDDIAAWFIGAVCVFVAVGMVYIFICPREDLEHATEVVHSIGDQYNDSREGGQSECSIFGDSCIVDEWGFECLFTRCVIDSRKEKE
jgi:hypothetical protein